jgi:transposase
LSEFRTRLVTHGAGERLLTELLSKLNEHSLLKGKHRQRTDSTHILSVVRDLNRLENVGETLRHALNSRRSASSKQHNMRFANNLARI